jgi:hypothetical protein
MEVGSILSRAVRQSDHRIIGLDEAKSKPRLSHMKPI